MEGGHLFHIALIAVTGNLVVKRPRDRPEQVVRWALVGMFMWDVVSIMWL